MQVGGFAHSCYDQGLSAYSLEQYALAGYARIKHVMQYHGFRR